MAGGRRRLAIQAERALVGGVLAGPRRVEIVDGLIAAVLDAGRSMEADETVDLPAGSLLAPGFIDLQVNGGGDALLNDAPTVDTIARIIAAHRRFGTTGLLPTLITDRPERLEALAAAAPEAMTLPGVLGFHLEGPHLNPQRKGIHPPECIRALAEADYRRLEAFARHGRSFVTLAPELAPAGMIRRLVGAGLRVAAGHSEATARQMAAAADAGLTGVTHLFNAMSQLTPREPGIVGAAMTDERLLAGIIADGIHVAPQSLQAAFRAMGRERLMLVTDAMPTAGGVSPSFSLQGRLIRLADGRLTDEAGVLAGAHLTMDAAVRNAVALMGASLADALVMASTTPARFLGLETERGAIAPGLRADLVALDAGLSVARVWVGGEAAF
jgi:N-acetylglucosamine-6-phosphate deacetylase